MTILIIIGLNGSCCFTFANHLKLALGVQAVVHTTTSARMLTQNMAQLFTDMNYHIITNYTLVDARKLKSLITEISDKLPGAKVIFLRGIGEPELITDNLDYMVEIGCISTEACAQFKALNLMYEHVVDATYYFSVLSLRKTNEITYY